jgi:hypothetical protein
MTDRVLRIHLEEASPRPGGQLSWAEAAALSYR